MKFKARVWKVGDNKPQRGLLRRRLTFRLCRSHNLNNMPGAYK